MLNATPTTLLSAQLALKASSSTPIVSARLALPIVWNVEVLLHVPSVRMATPLAHQALVWQNASCPASSAKITSPHYVQFVPSAPILPELFVLLTSPAT